MFYDGHMNHAANAGNRPISVKPMCVREEGVNGSNPDAVVELID